MTDLYFLILTAINIFVLGFMCVLVHLNETLNPKQTKRFFATFLLIGTISILELITILVDGAPKGFRIVNILSNYLGFGLTPAVPMLLVYALKCPNGVKGSLRVAFIVELIYVLLLTISLFAKGLVFYVDETNHYFRESGFFIYTEVYYAGMLYLMYHSLEMARMFQNRGRELMYGLTAFLALGTLAQILIPTLHITWLCVTLIAILYYLYCNEIWNQLDGLTGLLSQKSYLNRTLNLRPEDRMLIVLDLDDFKHINDTYGHLAGDRCLKEIADCMKKVYSNYGNCYRIGGDEFCVLLKKPEKETACKEKVFWMMQKRRESVYFLPQISYGSAKLLGQESIADTKARADQRMYENKREHKMNKQTYRG